MLPYIFIENGETIQKSGPIPPEDLEAVRDVLKIIRFNPESRLFEAAETDGTRPTIEYEPRTNP